MELNRFFFERAVNPPPQPLPLQARENVQQRVWKNPYFAAPPNFNMGIQSQLRNGSVKACLKKGTKAKYKRRKTQQSATVAKPFDPTKHCKPCRAAYLQRLGEDIKIPKRAHHVCCVRNKKTKGMAPATAFSNRASALSLPHFFCAPTNNNKHDAETKKKEATKFFNLSATSSVAAKTVIPVTSAASSERVVMPYANRGGNFFDVLPPSSSNRKSDAANLQKILEEGISKKNSSSSFLDNNKKQQQRYPVSVGVMFDYITSLITHWKAKDSNKPLPKTAVFKEAHKNYRLLKK